MKKLLAVALSLVMSMGFVTNVGARDINHVKTGEITYNLTLKHRYYNYGLAYAIAKRIIEVRKENGYDVNESVNLRWTKAAVDAAMQRAAEYGMTFTHESPNHMDGFYYMKSKYHFVGGSENLCSINYGKSDEETAKNIVNTWLSDDGHARVIWKDDEWSEFGVGVVDGSCAFIEGNTLKGGDTSTAPKTGGEYRDVTMPFGTMGQTLSPCHTDSEGGVITDVGYLDVTSGGDWDEDFASETGNWPEKKTRTVEPGKTLQMHLYALDLQEHITGELTLHEQSKPTYSHFSAADELKQEEFKWESSNPKVATVDEHGKITGISKGTAQISYGLPNSSIVSIANDYGEHYRMTTGEEAQEKPTAENIPAGLEDRMKNTITIKVESPDDPLPQEVRNLSGCSLYCPAGSSYTYLKYGTGLLDDVLDHSSLNDSDKYNDYDVEGVQTDGQLVYGGKDPYTYTGPVAYYKITGRKKDKGPYYSGTIYVKCPAYADTLKYEDITPRAQFSTEEEYSTAAKNAVKKTKSKKEEASEEAKKSEETKKSEESRNSTTVEDIEREPAKRSARSEQDARNDAAGKSKSTADDQENSEDGQSESASENRKAAKKVRISAPKTTKSGSARISLKNAESVIWKASKGAKLTKVSRGGVTVTAKKAGTYTITAKTNGKTYTVRIKFRDYLAAPRKITIRKGKSYKLKVKSSRKVTYKTSSKKIKVKKGKVKASKKGRYTITARAGKMKKKIKVTVK